MSAAAALYSREVLTLATGLAAYPLDPSLALHGTARSATCGSSIDIGITCDPAQHISRLGLQARACAIGQASAAIFAQAAPGKSAGDIEAALYDIEAWLAGGALPEWPSFAAIAAARDYPARHGAILLPWRAALVALAPRG